VHQTAEVAEAKTAALGQLAALSAHTDYTAA
jgi:hypothetical protein